MGVFQQLKLLFKKNYLLRKRQPGILLLEVLWPIFIVILVTLIRQGVPPEKIDTCHFQERAMPSAGVVPFLQTFVCNLDNRCETKEELKVSEDISYKVSALVGELAPYIGSDNTVVALESMDKGVLIIQTLNKLLANNSLIDELGKSLKVKSLFKDPEMLKEILMNNYGFTSEKTVDALLNSTVNISQMLNLLGYRDLRGIICSPEKLGLYLLFPTTVNVMDVSRDLCGIDVDKIPELTQLLQDHLDVAEIVRLMGLFEKFKEVLTGDYTMSQGFNDIADMLDLVFKSPSVMNTIKSMSSLKDISGILRKIPKWINMFDGTSTNLQPVLEFIGLLDPIIEQIQPNDTIWHSIVSGVSMANGMIKVFEGNWNGTSNDLMQIIDGFLNNLELAMGGISGDIKMIMETITDLKLSNMFSQAVNGTLMDKQVLNSLNKFEVSLEKLELWNATAPIVSVLNKVMKMVNMTMHRTLGLEEALMNLVGTDGSLQSSFNHVLNKGPNVTRAVLDAFTDSKTLAKMFENSFSYMSVCDGIMTTIQNEIGLDTSDELRPILCTGNAADAVQKLVDSLDLDKIQIIINETVTFLLDINNEDVQYDKDASFSSLYQTVRDLIETSFEFSNMTKQTWGDLFSQFKMADVNLNSRDWHPVLQMMNTNYVSSSIVAMGRALGETMYNAPLAEPMSKYVHMAELIAEYTYDQLYTATETYSSDSSMAKLMHYVTEYAPEITTAAIDMFSDPTVIYELIESEDLYQMICNGDWTSKLNVPDYVPMKDIENIICKTNWNEVIQTMNGINPKANELIMEMDKTIKHWNNMTFNISMDWISLMDYTERTVDLLSDKKSMPSLMGFGNLIAQMNFTNVGKAFDILSDRMEHMTTNDFARLSDIGIFMIEQVDFMLSNTSSSNSTVWNSMKKYMLVMNGYLKLLNELYSPMLESNSLQTMLDQYPKSVTDIITKTAEITPNFLVALRETILNPEKLIRMFINDGLNTPDCSSTYLSEFMIDKDSKLEQYEKYLCKMNWTNFAEDLAQQSPPLQEYNKLVMKLFSDEFEEAHVNWTELAMNVDRYIEVTSEQANIYAKHFDFSPLNISAIDMSWSEFVMGMKSLQNIDSVRLTKLMSEIQPLLYSLLNSGGTNNTDFISKSINSQIYITDVITKFALQQLEYFNSTSEIHLLDYLGSEELKKVFASIEYSPDMIQILFNMVRQSYVDPTKLSLLMVPSNIEKLCTDVSTFSELLVLDKVKTSPEMIQKAVCDLSLNITVVFDELSQNWPGFQQLIDNISSIVTMNSTVEIKVNYKEMMADNQRLSELMNSLATHPPTILLFNMTNWLNSTVYEQKWNGFISDLNSTISKLQDPRLLIEYELKYFNLVYNTAITKATYNKVLHILDVVLDINTNLSRVSIEEEFEGYPNMIKIISLAEYIPEVLQVYIYNSLNNAELMVEFSIEVPSWDSVCENPGQYFKSPDDLQFNITTFLDNLCMVNFTELQHEAENNEWFQMSNQTYEFNLTKIADKLVSLFETNGGINLRLFNGSLYEHMIQRVEIYLNQSASTFMSPDYLFRSLGQLYATSTPGIRHSLSWLPITLATLDVVMDRILSVENETSFSPGDLFKGAPQIQAVINLIQEPGVIEVLLNSLNSQKFSQLLTSTNSTETFMLICDPTTDMNDYLVSSDKIDVNLLRDKLCLINITELVTEFETEFNVEWISQVAQDKANIDWISFGHKYTKITNLFTHWSQTPPTVIIPTEWENGSYWLAMLERYSQLRSSPQAINEEIKSFMEKLEPMLNQDGYREFGLILETVLDIVNQNLIELENKTLTINNMLHTIPVFREIMNAIGLNGDILETILTAPVKNPELLLKSLTQGDVNKIFCGNTSIWYSILKLPHTFDTSPLNMAICEHNNTLLLQNIVRNLDLEELMTSLNDSSYKFNFENVFNKSVILGKNIESFLKFLPLFNDTEGMELLSTSYNETNLWNMLTVYSTISQVVTGGSNKTGTDMFLRTGSIIFEFLNNFINKLEINGPTFDLASLFSGSPTFMRIINMFLSLSPDPINGLLGIRLKLDKNMDFANLVMDPDQLNEVFCDQSKFNEYFKVPENLNVSIIINGLCDLNFTLIASELSSSFMIDAFIDKLTNSFNNTTPFKIETYIHDYQKFNKLFMKFFEIRNVTFEGEEFEKLFNINGTVLMDNLMKMLQINGLEYNTIPVELINNLFKDYNETEWKTTSTVLHAFDMYLKLLNENLRNIKGKPMSLGLLVNKTEVGPILMTVLMKPEWLEDLVQIHFKPDKLLKLMSNGSRERLCSEEFWDAFILPTNDSGVLKYLQQNLCEANFTVMEWELITMQINGYQLMQQLSEVGNEVSNSRAINITELNYDIQQMVQLLTEIIDSYTSGKQPVKEFANVEGFRAIFKKFQGELGQKVMNMSSVWSTEMASLIFPSLSNMDPFTSRTINTINIFMDIINDRLKDVQDGTISVNTLLGHSQPLVSIMEAYINIGKMGADVWTTSNIDFDRVAEVVINSTILDSKCTDDSLIVYISNGTTPTELHKNLETILCSFITLPSAFKQFINYEEIEMELSRVWNMSSEVVTDYDKYMKNIQQFNEYIVHLAQTPYTVDSGLQQLFNMNHILKFIENFFSNPSVIFKIIESYSGYIDKLFEGEDRYKPDLSIISHVVILPLTHILEQLEAHGLTIDGILSDPMKMLAAVEVLTNYNTQLEISMALYSSLTMQFTTSPKFVSGMLCNKTALESTIGGLIKTSDFDGVQQILCHHEAPEWEYEFKKIGIDTGTLFDISTLLNSKIMDYACTEMTKTFTSQFYNTSYSYPNCTFNIDDYSYTFNKFIIGVEKLAHLLMVKGDNTSDLWLKPQSSNEAMWKILNNIFIQTPVDGLIGVLKLADVNSGIRESIWNTSWEPIKQVTKLINSFESMLNSYLEKFIDAPKPVIVQDILPNSQQVQQLLHDILSPTTTAEFLTMVINPKKFLSLAYVDNWIDIACNLTLFNETFTLSSISGIDVEGIQMALCHVARNKTSTLKQLVDLVDAGDVLRKFDDLLRGNFNKTEKNINLWKTLKQGTERLIKNLKKIQSVSVNSTSLHKWFSPILNMLSTLNNPSLNSVDEMCQSLISYIVNTEGYENQYQSLLNRVLGYMKLASSQMDMLTEIDDIVCQLTGDFNIKEAIHHLQKLHFFDVFTPIYSINLTSEFQCHDMMSTINGISKSFNKTITNGIQFNRMSQCLSNGGLDNFSGFLKSVDSIFEISTDILGLMEEPGTIEMLKKFSPNLQPVLDFVLKAIAQQKTVVTTFGSLMKNSTSVLDYFTNILQIAPYVTESLLKSTINLDYVQFLNDSVEQIQETLCDPDQLASLIQLPDFALVNITELSDFLCKNGSNKAAITIKSAADLASITKELLKLANTGVNQQWLNNITDHTVTFISDLQSISGFIEMMGGGLNLDVLQKDIGKIDRFLMGSGPERIVRSLTAILDDLRYVFPNKESEDILGEISTFIKGLMGIDLIQSRVISAINVADLLKDPLLVERYMVEELGFTEKMAKTVLGGTYSLRVFLNTTVSIMEDGFSCKKLFNNLIILNTTDVQLTDIINVICNLNKTVGSELVEKLLPELDIGNMVKMYVTTSADSILKSANLSMADTKDLTEKLSNAQVGLKKAAMILQDSANDTLKNDILKQLMNVPEAQTAEALTSLENMLCGRKSPDGLAKDSFNLQSLLNVRKVKLKQSELDTLPSEFCRDIYRNIMKKPIGSIIWTYLKPIMRGKILFTPNTPQTREIIKKANDIFDVLSEVRKVAHAWAVGVPHLQDLTREAKNMDKIKSAISSDFVKALLESTSGLNADSLIEGLSALASDQFNMQQLNGIKTAAQLIINYTECMELDRFIGIETEKELEIESLRLSQESNFMAGIVFTNIEPISRNKREASKQMPKHIIYKIRMDTDNVPTTHRNKDRTWKPGPEAEFASDMRYMRGFIQLQDMIEKSIIILHGGVNNTKADPGIYLQQFPYPCHVEDTYIHYLGSYMLPVLMTFAWLASLGIATRNLVYDRENGQEETLRIMGMKSGLNWLAWFFSTMLLMILVCILIALILKYGNIFYYTNFLITFLYLITFCLSSTMLCYMVSAFFTRTTLAILSVLIIYFLSYLPYIVLISMEVQMEFWQKIIACLSCTTAFSFGAQFLASLEELGVGLHWNNINTRIQNDDMTFKWSCIMMVIDSVIYLVIGWYIRNVKSAKYGVSQPWYFICSPSYWSGKSSGSRDGIYEVPATPFSDVLFEKAPSNLPVGISTRNLRKVYNGTTAVSDLNISFYENQVTVLLGHNGAAKTTTMNMITGVLEPTSGEVDIYNKHPGNCSGMLGICPQHNTIFDFMTVEEHMEFYAGVKSERASVDEIKGLLKDVDLWHVRDVQGKNLSGGMQRRLCVAMAFVGESRAIILDEPTSGVDPYARKHIWNLILKHKLGRTVLVSTHHLDEADVIGDRVVILHTGKLLCSGTPDFLKSFIGGGLSLTLEKKLPSPSSSHAETDTPCNTLDVAAFIKGYHPNAILLESIGTEFSFKLPKDEHHMKSWGDFFEDLDQYKDKLKIASYGVSDTTLEEVFLKVTTIVDNGEELNGLTLKEDLMKQRNRSRSDSLDSDTTSEDSSNANLIKVDRNTRKSGCDLSIQQFGAILLKRFHHYRRDWRLIFSALILPVLVVLVALGFAKIRPEHYIMPSLIMTPALYGPDSYMFYKDESLNSMSNKLMKSLIEQPGVGTTCMKNFKPKGFICLPDNEIQRVFISSNDTTPTCTCDNYKYTCDKSSGGFSPGEMKTETTEILQKLNGYDIDRYLLDSFSDFKEKRYGGWSFEDAEEGESVVKIWFNNKGFHAMPAFRNAYSNLLLRSKVTQDQADYGITLYSHPISLSSQPLTDDIIDQNAADGGIAVIILMAFTFIPSALVLLSVNERLNNEKHIQSISGVSPLLYCLASFTWDMFIYIIAVGGAVIVICIIQPEAYYSRSNLAGVTVLLILFGWSILPIMYSTLKLFKSGSSAYLVLFCINMFLGIFTVVTIIGILLFKQQPEIQLVYDTIKYVFLIFPQYCLCQGMIDLSTNNFQYKLFLRYGEDVYRDPFTFDLLGWNFVAMGIQGLVFFIITVVIEYKPQTQDRFPSEMLGDYIKEEDVQNEAERIATDQDDILVVNKLSKVFRRGFSKFMAVDNVSFGVHKGECFGLLGVNGAGKTTSFRMLTGSLKPSNGFASLHGKSLCGNNNKSALQDIGYCPQYGGLDEYLTAEEILLFYARIRGLSGTKATSTVSDIVSKLKLTSYADKPIKTYSGGNKRKVSLAIAMLGSPDVLFLDEPTTGMDPGTQRLAWKVISMATRHGQSVVLTSHSMDECDRLCSRLAIMVNGQLKCLGSPQHLKHKFGDGYIVRVNVPGLSNNKVSIIQLILSRFPGTEIKEETSEVVQLNIPQHSGSVANIFAVLEQAQNQKQILAYSLTQTSLDEVFINFAKEQSDNIEGDDTSNTSSGGSTEGKYSSSLRGNYNNTFAFVNPEYEGFHPTGNTNFNLNQVEDVNKIVVKL